MHCSRTYKYFIQIKIKIKMSPTTLFTHLKIILLQYFQFSPAVFAFFFFFYFLFFIFFIHVFQLSRDNMHCSLGPMNSHALFTGPTSTLFRKKKFKNRSHGTIYTFKNYFVTVFSVFSKISGIQMDL